MKVEKLMELIGAEFYTGVPDSQLKDFPLLMKTGSLY